MPMSASRWRMPFGLITPIVFKAETKGLVEISNEVKDAGRRGQGQEAQAQRV